MSFSEKTKLLAKKKSAFRCCICHEPFVEIHHIIPREEGGPDTLNNAAPLCATCHDLYGGNPEKRKIIRQMRDEWWELMNKREAHILGSGELDENIKIKPNQDHKGRLKSKYIAIYHMVFAKEKIDPAAKHIFDLIKHAQEFSPGQRRILYLDIEGHRNDIGGFDRGMFELQTSFLLGYMMPYLTELVMPLGHFINQRGQRNDLPDGFAVVGELTPEKLSELVDKYENLEIWLSDKRKLLRSGDL
jgi:hypothetical protein